MKVNPNLFNPPTPSPRNNGEASDARRAFEAMLSASASRTRIQQPAAAGQDRTLSTILRSEQADKPRGDDPAIMPLPRPGRVLDIKV